MNRTSIAFVAPHALPALRVHAGLAANGGYGGAEVQMAILGHGLAARGHAVYFLCRSATPEPVGDVRIVPLASPGKGWHPAPLLSLWRALRATPATTFYQRCALPLTGLVAHHCARTGRRFVFAAANDRDLDGRAREVLGAARYALFTYGLRRADPIVAQSEAQIRLAPPALRSRMTVMPSAFEARGIEPRPEPDRPAILWVGNLLAKKAPLELLSLARALPDVAFIAVAPEATDPQLAARFTREVASLPNVERHGRLRPEELAVLYRRASLLLSTSEAEGVPNVFLEAWARGVAIVTLRFDPGDLLATHGLGWVLASSDPAADLRRRLEDVIARRTAGTAARHYVLSRHSATRVLDQFEAMLTHPAKALPGAGDVS